MEKQGNTITTNVLAHSEPIQASFEKRCCVKNKNFNEADKSLTTLCFIFDINFPYSFQYIKDKKIANQKIKLFQEHLPQNIDIKEIEKIVNEYINQKL